MNWLNAVDADYRGQLREFNELNFARFDAKLEQRVAQLDARWAQRWAQLDAKLEQGLAQLSGQFSDRLRTAEIRLAGLTIAWVPVVLGIFEFVFRR